MFSLSNEQLPMRGGTTCCMGLDLKIRELIARLASGEVKEIILATNPSLEGDATAMYISQQLQPLGIRITRLARGLPVGGDLEYADANTLHRALSGRQAMD